MKIVLFGAGKVGTTFMRYSLRKDCQIVSVVDNDAEKWGKDFFGNLIESPMILQNLEFDILLLTIGGGAAIGVSDQLMEMGIEREKIVFASGWRNVEFCANRFDRFFIIPKKAVVPFVKKPLEKALSPAGGETKRAQERRIREGFFEKYCQGEGLDIGCGGDPVTPNCAGWDLCNGDAQFLHGVPDESFDFVYSSHCIEHMLDVRVAISNWFRVVRRGGYLIICGPERDLYEKRRMLPSRFNSDHKHMFLVCRKEAPDTLDICEELREGLSIRGGHYRIEYIRVCHDGWKELPPEQHSAGEYAFEIVVKKL